jgi:hypothetical protein
LANGSPSAQQLFEQIGRVDTHFHRFPFLEVVDMFAATQVIITSAVVGGGLISWLIPRDTLVEKIGTRFRAEAHVMVTVGRWLPVAVVLFLIVTTFT